MSKKKYSRILLLHGSRILNFLHVKNNVSCLRSVLRSRALYRGGPRNFLKSSGPYKRKSWEFFQFLSIWRLAPHLTRSFGRDYSKSLNIFNDSHTDSLRRRTLSLMRRVWSFPSSRAYIQVKSSEFFQVPGLIYKASLEFFQVQDHIASYFQHKGFFIVST